MNTEQTFRDLCKAHDLTYMYSDDGDVHRRGYARMDAIRAASKEIGQEAAERIWNEVVDSKMGERYRKEFYWKVPK